MPIDLSLARISRLLAHLGNPHHSSYRCVHVAGTNGKGSTIAYLSAVLLAARVYTGRFTSPHLVSYNDCVAINNETYPMPKFSRVHQMVTREDARLGLRCTEFELLAATAFKIFQLENVQLALVEVGLGGLLDATNVLQPDDRSAGVVVCGITKICLDHMGLLGTTLTQIAAQKAGIIKKGVPVVVDASNVPEVLLVVQTTADAHGSAVVAARACESPDVAHLIPFSPLRGAYQEQNLAVALGILRILADQGVVAVDEVTIRRGLAATVWPGRLQTVVDPHTQLTVLLDGAHNKNAAVELGRHLQILREKKEETGVTHADQNNASAGSGLVFVVALTRGKAADDIFRHILRPHDTVYPVTFTTPEHMPFVECCSAEEVAESARKHCANVRNHGLKTVDAVFRHLLENKRAGDCRDVVVCGSLYLCSDVLRYIASA